MRDEHGELQVVDLEKARQQWQDLADAYRRIDIGIDVLPAAEGLPDLCFTANPSLALPLPDGTCDVWLSQMAHPSRAAEVAIHAKFFAAQDLIVHEFPNEVQRFEGCGDGILHPGRFLMHAGTGPRTSVQAWEVFDATYPELVVLHYELQDERFYHLDTALTPLDQHTAMFVPSAFNERGLDLLTAAFDDLIELPLEEALSFAGNAHCPDGHHVLIQSGCERTEAALRERGFKPLALDTSEFRKSGGSVFCLKMAWR